MKNSTELGDLVQNQKEFNMGERKKSKSKYSVPVPLFIVEGYTEYNYIVLLKELYAKDIDEEKFVLACNRHPIIGSILKKHFFHNKNA